MTGGEYQVRAMRTNDRKADNRLHLAMIQALADERHLGDLLQGLMGLSGESGELIDLFKKWIFHGTPMDETHEQHAKREMGDILWYVSLICHAMDWDMDEIMQMNIEKLQARYPDGFDTERANHREEDDV